jgi:hypothetical protein
MTAGMRCLAKSGVDVFEMGSENANTSNTSAIWSSVRVITAVYILSVAVNILCGLFITYRMDINQVDADEREYLNLAAQITSGSIDLHPRRTLLFPLAIAAARAVSDNFLALQIILSVIAATAAPLLVVLCLKLTGRLASSITAGLALTFWPPQVFLATSLYSEALALPVFLACMCAIPAGSRVAQAPANAHGLRWALASGALLAVATHVRPMYLLFLPFAFFVLWREEAAAKLAVRRAVIFVGAFAVLLLPWSAYMTTRFGQPILVTSNSGETIAGGLNPNLFSPEYQRDIQLAHRRAWNGPGKWIPAAETGYVTPAEMQLPYAQLDSVLRERTFRWILENPFDAGYLQLRKLLYMWGLYPIWSNETKVVFFGNIPIVALGLMTLLGLWHSKSSRRQFVRLWIVPLFVSFVSLISWGSWRFRQPADATMLAFCALTFSDRIRFSLQEVVHRYFRVRGAHAFSNTDPGRGAPLDSPQS